MAEAIQMRWNGQATLAFVRPDFQVLPASRVARVRASIHRSIPSQRTCGVSTKLGSEEQRSSPQHRARHNERKYQDFNNAHKPAKKQASLVSEADKEGVQSS
jgi:hypothetical protein